MGSLVIIGNGFDLHHNMNTSFSGFINNVEGEDEFMSPSIKRFKNEVIRGFDNSPVSLVQVAFNEKEDWNKIEMYLKYSYLKKQYYNDEQEKYEEIIAYDKSFDNLKYFKVEFMNHLIKEESRCLKEEKINDNLKEDLLKADRIISYNYTRLLENLYKINEEKIVHINGKIDETTNMIIGYEDNSLNPEDVVDDNIIAVDKMLLKSNLRENMNNLFTYKSLVETYDELVIIGHSLGESDNDDWKILKVKLNESPDLTISIYIHDQTPYERQIEYYYNKITGVINYKAIYFKNYKGEKVGEKTPPLWY